MSTKKNDFKWFFNRFFPQQTEDGEEQRDQQADAANDAEDHGNADKEPEEEVAGEPGEQVLVAPAQHRDRPLLGEPPRSARQLFRHALASQGLCKI